MAHIDESGDIARAANELYWESDASVNQIAERLALSKGTLYGLVRPLPAEIGCPRCATEMVYPNRTALEKGFLACPGCQFEEEEEVVRSEGGAALPPPPMDGVDEDAAELLGQGSYPARTVAGAALLGMAAGMLLARGFRDR